jgi:hypothetical protein
MIAKAFILAKDKNRIGSQILRDHQIPPDRAGDTANRPLAQDNSKKPPGRRQPAARQPPDTGAKKPPGRH